VKTDLGSRIVGAWSIVPAAVSERAVIAEWRNRVESTSSEITVQMELARHGAHTFWGLASGAGGCWAGCQV
jgi:hypothetical protein